MDVAGGKGWGRGCAKGANEGTLQGKPELLPAGQKDAGGQSAHTCISVTHGA
jgi:hypothetical protein